MANSQASGTYKEYATVDTTPGADGYWTNSISLRVKKLTQVFFSIRGTGVATVTLQFRCEGDTDWTDYSNDGVAFVTGDRKIIESNAGNVQWRAGVKQANYTSGSITFGFDW
jgi:hypothetical protein